ncbi:PREDICTED: uncharacterized protein DS12 from 2D-PAGE of leaf, chloroplastic [Populus euphratica]|uniref:ACT domain-containing protein ACR n=1 Tax=Populus euphratica TaxID=75702 RepID=A0AAJ6XW05_POPEU|nr:PREDICTED: uncharacterized protein DS12 from 2D-PAGE of leaf, chloroplastic [Populus euphratica]
MTPPTVMQINLHYPLTIFNRRLQKRRALSLKTSMALSNSLLCSSSSSLSQIDYGYIDFNNSPQVFPPPERSCLAFSPIRDRFSELGNGMIGLSKKKNIVHASARDLNASTSSTSLKPEQDADGVPIPVVLIDQDSDSESTIVQLSFGDRLGALIDTMNALKDLGLDVAKGTVLTEGPVKQTKFFITRLDSGRKVEDPDMLERIRLTIINNLLKYHPVCVLNILEKKVLLYLSVSVHVRLCPCVQLYMRAPGEQIAVQLLDWRVFILSDSDFSQHMLLCFLDVDIGTHGPKRRFAALLCVETADRPGLLVEIIKIIADVNIDVESAEIDTEGLIAKDKFHVSYGGAALNSSLSQVLVNCLRYYLRRPETDTDSY